MARPAPLLAALALALATSTAPLAAARCGGHGGARSSAVASAGRAVAAAPPAFCHGLDCPVFRTLNKTDAYETRAYEAATWASVDVASFSLALAQGRGFTRLFDYISGANVGSRKVEMTAPVLTRASPGAGPFCKSNYTVSFMVPFADASDPPTPTGEGVYIHTTPPATVYVTSRGGFLVDDYSVAGVAKQLLDALNADGVAVDEAAWAVAGYDPPFRLSGRHTEVWFFATDADDVAGRSTA